MNRKKSEGNTIKKDNDGSLETYSDCSEFVNTFIHKNICLECIDDEESNNNNDIIQITLYKVAYNKHLILTIH